MITAKQLRISSWDFVFENIPALKAQAALAAPFILALAFISSLIETFEVKHLSLLVNCLSLYFWGCFAFTWHRFSLMGERENKPMNPLSPHKDAHKFLILFLLFSIAPYCFAFAILRGYIAADKFLTLNPALVGLIGMAVVCGFFAFLWVLLRLSFILPAKSVGVSITLDETKIIAKGLRLKIIWVGILYTLLFSVVALVYGITTGFVFVSISGMVGDAMTQESVTAAFLGFLLGLPIYVLLFFFVALNVTLLSHAYQWGVQNNR